MFVSLNTNLTDRRTPAERKQQGIIKPVCVSVHVCLQALAEYVCEYLLQ